MEARSWVKLSFEGFREMHLFSTFRQAARCSARCWDAGAFIGGVVFFFLHFTGLNSFVLFLVSPTFFAPDLEVPLSS